MQSARHKTNKNINVTTSLTKYLGSKVHCLLKKKIEQAGTILKPCLLNNNIARKQHGNETEAVQESIRLHAILNYNVKQFDWILSQFNPWKH